MAQDYFQDNTPGRSIRNISVERPPMRPPVGDMNGMRPSPSSQNQNARQPRYDEAKPRKNAGRLLLYWLIAFVILTVVVAGVLFASWNTTITVTPRSQVVVFSDQSSLTAYPEGTPDVPAGSLTYAVMERLIEESAEAEATGKERVEETASGTVTISNAYSGDPMRLIKNTRFEASDGRIYRIRQSVVVPGRQGNKPGTLNATIFADEPGDKHNITGNASFTLPGLKSSSPEMYEQVTARSSGNIAGGFVGEKPVVQSTNLDAARLTLREKLQTKARELATTDIPAGSISFPDFVVISFVSHTPEGFTSGKATIREEALVRVPVIKQDDFARAIGAMTVADVEADEVAILDPSTITVRLVTTPDEVGSKPIDIALQGRATLVWKVDGPSFATELAGRPEEATQTVMQGYPSIANVVVSLRPFWRSTFPADPAEITVEVGPPVEDK